MKTAPANPIRKLFENCFNFDLERDENIATYERFLFYSVIKFSKHAHCPYTYGLFFPWALFTSSHINIISVGIISVGIISVLSHVVLTF